MGETTGWRVSSGKREPACKDPAVGRRWVLPPRPHHPADSTVPTAATEASAPSWPQAGLLGGVWLRPVALWGAGAGLGGTGGLERSWASSTISTILWVEPIKPSQRRGCPPPVRDAAQARCLRATGCVLQGVKGARSQQSEVGVPGAPGQLEIRASFARRPLTRDP